MTTASPPAPASRPDAPRFPGWLTGMALALAAVVGAAGLAWVLLPRLIGISPITLLVGLAVATAAGVLFAITVRWPIVGMWVTMLLLFFGNVIAIPELIIIGRYLPTLGIGLFVSAVAVRALYRGRVRIGLPLATAAFALFAALVVVSGVIHGIPLADTGLSLVIHLRYPLFFLAILALMPPAAQLVTWIQAFMIFTLFQIPATLFQFFVQGRTDDAIVGTLGTNGALADILFAGMTILVGWWLVNRRRGLAVAIAVGLLALPMLYGFILAFVFTIVPLGLAFMFLVLGDRWKVPARVLVATVGGLVAIALAATVAVSVLAPDVLDSQTRNTLRDFELARDLNPVTVNFGSIGRLTILPLGLPVVFQNPADALIGLGPETAQGGLLEASTVGQGIDATGLAIGEVGGVACRMLVDAGLRCREPQSFRALVEFGIIGTALYVAGLVLVAVAVWRATRTVPRPLQWAGIAFGGYAAGLVIQFFYTGIWRVDSAQIPFWVLAATAIVFAVQHAESPAPEASPE